jgi:hypothetical protein
MQSNQASAKSPTPCAVQFKARLELGSYLSLYWNQRILLVEAYSIHQTELPDAFSEGID